MPRQQQHLPHPVNEFLEKQKAAILLQLFPHLKHRFGLMENSTVLSEFVLMGLSEIPTIQHFLFLLCFIIYIFTLTGNLMIISLIFTDCHLHAPMYFFLSNLACIDISSSTVTVPRLLFDFFRDRRTISIVNCITQLFFFLTFISTETFLLAAMSFDRYVAICLPLHYNHIMHWKLCAQMALFVWIVGVLYSLMYTLTTLRLYFCGPNVIQSFFCDLRQLLQLSCNNNFINILLIFLIGGVLGLSAFLITFLPYIRILITVLRIKSNEGRKKAFSTCTSHLTIVFIFYGTSAFNYFHPSTEYIAFGCQVSVIYAIITPLLNPLVYCLRNNELREALRRGFSKVECITITALIKK
ncbi:olfactory receptor 5B12-like [Rhinophrynus dorsalis]